MRFLVQVSIPIEKGNEAATNGTMGKLFGQILEDIKPEAAYFTAHNGKRGGIFVVNVNDASEMPRIAEPFFLAFNATVTFEPAMLPEDLMKAEPHIESAAEKYG
jgi:hypothetical protein